MQAPLGVKTRVAITLYYLCNKGRYRKVANAFGIGRSTVSTIIKQAVCALRSQSIVVHLKIKAAGTSFAFARGHVNISKY